MVKNQYKKIYKAIKKFDTIVIARHVGADPDALGSSIGLRESIRKTFPSKKVYTVGLPTSKFKYMGQLDHIDEDTLENALLIITDTPDKKRVDGINTSKYKYTIKIDHHPYIETFCDIEWIDDTASSASEMIIDLINNTKLVMDKDIASVLYLGLVADTDRFLFQITSPKTFRMVGNLIEQTGIKISELYPNLYIRPYREIRFQGFIAANMTVTKNGLGYIKIDDSILKEYEVDAATGGNLVNNFNFINEVIAWTILTEDKNNDMIRVSIRSRGPVINEAAGKFGGGGHKMASGAKLNDFLEADMLIEELDKVCEEYKEGLNK